MVMFPWKSIFYNFIVILVLGTVTESQLVKNSTNYDGISDTLITQLETSITQYLNQKITRLELEISREIHRVSLTRHRRHIETGHAKFPTEYKWANINWLTVERQTNYGVFIGASVQHTFVDRRTIICPVWTYYANELHFIDSVEVDNPRSVESFTINGEPYLIFALNSDKDFFDFKIRPTHLYKLHKDKLEPFQTFLTIGTTAWKSFLLDEDLYLAEASVVTFKDSINETKCDGTQISDSAEIAIYKWMTTGFVKVNVLKLRQVVDVDTCSSEGKKFLVAASRHSKGSVLIYEIQTMDSGILVYKLFQELPATSGVRDVECFESRGRLFLAVANQFEMSPKSEKNMDTKSAIYIFNGLFFEIFQQIKTQGATKWTFLHDELHLQMETSAGVYSFLGNLWVQVQSNIFEENAIAALDDGLVVTADNSKVSVQKWEISQHTCATLKALLDDTRVTRSAAIDMVEKTLEDIPKTLDVLAILRQIESEMMELQKQIEFVDHSKGLLLEEADKSLTLKDLNAKNITFGKLVTQRMNSIDIGNFAKKVVTIKDGDVLSGLDFERVELVNATIGPNTFDVPFDLVLTDRTNVFSSVKLTTSLFVDDLTVTGKIDGILTKDLMLTSGDQVLCGNLFTKDVQVSSLSSKLVNGVDWLNDVVTVNRGGVVTSHKTFTQAIDIISAIKVSGRINGFPTRRLGKVVTLDEETIVTVPMSWKKVVFADDLVIVDGKMNELVIPKDIAGMEQEGSRRHHHGKRRILRQLAVQNLDCSEVEVTGNVIPAIPLWSSDALRITDHDLVFRKVRFLRKVNFRSIQVPQDVLSHLIPVNANREYHLASVNFSDNVVFTRDIEVSDTINGVNVTALNNTIVTVDGHQVISGNVVFKMALEASKVSFQRDHVDVVNLEGPLEISIVNCRSLVTDILNGHTPKALFEDVLKNNGHRQVITGWKSFEGWISSDSNSSLVIDGHLTTKGVDFKNFTKDAVMRTDDVKVISGSVTFNNFIKLEHLMTETINEVGLKSLYEDSLLKDEWRTLTVEYVESNRLYAEKVNDVLVDQLYQTAILKTSEDLPANLKFHRIIIEDSLMLKSLNGILFSDYVVKSPQMTIITGYKTFEGHVHISGDLTIIKQSPSQMMLPSVLEVSSAIFKGDVETDGYWCNIDWKRFWNGVILTDSPISLRRIVNMSNVDVDTVDIAGQLQDVTTNLTTPHNDTLQTTINFWDEVTFKRLLLRDIKVHPTARVEDLSPQISTLRFEDDVVVEGDVFVSGYWLVDESLTEPFETISVKKLTVDGNVLEADDPSCSLRLEGDSLECHWCKIMDTVSGISEGYSSRVFQGFELIRILRDCHCIFKLEDSLVALLNVGDVHYELVEASRNVDGIWTLQHIGDIYLQGQLIECLHFIDSNNDTVILISSLIIYQNVVEIWKLRKDSDGQLSSLNMRQETMTIRHLQSLEVVTLKGGTLLFALMDNSSLAVYTWLPSSSMFQLLSVLGSWYRWGQVEHVTIDDEPFVMVATADEPKWILLMASKWVDSNQELIVIDEIMIKGHLDTLKVCSNGLDVIGARLDDGHLLVMTFREVFEELPTSPAMFRSVECLNFADQLWLLAETETSLQIFRHPDYVEPIQTYSHRSLTSVVHLEIAGEDVLLWKASNEVFWKVNPFFELDKKCEKCNADWRKTCDGIIEKSKSTPMDLQLSTLSSEVDNTESSRTVTFPVETTYLEGNGVSHFSTEKLMFADTDKTWTPSTDEHQMENGRTLDVSGTAVTTSIDISYVDAMEETLGTSVSSVPSSLSEMGYMSTSPMPHVKVTDGKSDQIATTDEEQYKIPTDVTISSATTKPEESVPTVQSFTVYGITASESTSMIGATTDTSYSETFKVSLKRTPDSAVTAPLEPFQKTESVVTMSPTLEDNMTLSTFDVTAGLEGKTSSPDSSYIFSSWESGQVEDQVTATESYISSTFKLSETESYSPTSATSTETDQSVTMETDFSYSTESVKSGTLHGENGTEQEVIFSETPTEATDTTIASTSYPIITISTADTEIRDSSGSVPQYLPTTMPNISQVTNEADVKTTVSTDSETYMTFSEGSPFLRSHPTVSRQPMLATTVEEHENTADNFGVDYMATDVTTIESHSPTISGTTSISFSEILYTEDSFSRRESEASGTETLSTDYSTQKSVMGDLYTVPSTTVSEDVTRTTDAISETMVRVDIEDYSFVTDSTASSHISKSTESPASVPAMTPASPPSMTPTSPASVPDKIKATTSTTHVSIVTASMEHFKNTVSVPTILQAIPDNVTMTATDFLVTKGQVMVSNGREEAFSETSPEIATTSNGLTFNTEYTAGDIGETEGTSDTYLPGSSQQFSIGTSSPIELTTIPDSFHDVKTTITSTEPAQTPHPIILGTSVSSLPSGIETSTKPFMHTSHSSKLTPTSATILASHSKTRFLENYKRATADENEFEVMATEAMPDTNYGTGSNTGTDSEVRELTLSVLNKETTTISHLSDSIPTDLTSHTVVISDLTGVPYMITETSTYPTTPSLTKLSTNTSVAQLTLPTDIVMETESAPDWLPTTMAPVNEVEVTTPDDPSILFETLETTEVVTESTPVQSLASLTSDMSTVTNSEATGTEIISTEYSTEKELMGELCSVSCTPVETPAPVVDDIFSPLPTNDVTQSSIGISYPTDDNINFTELKTSDEFHQASTLTTTPMTLVQTPTTIVFQTSPSAKSTPQATISSSQPGFKTSTESIIPTLHPYQLTPFSAAKPKAIEKYQSFTEGKFPMEITSTDVDELSSPIGHSTVSYLGTNPEVEISTASVDMTKVATISDGISTDLLTLNTNENTESLLQTDISSFHTEVSSGSASDEHYATPSVTLPSIPTIKFKYETVASTDLPSSTLTTFETDNDVTDALVSSNIVTDGEDTGVSSTSTMITTETRTAEDMAVTPFSTTTFPEIFTEVTSTEMAHSSGSAYQNLTISTLQAPITITHVTSGTTGSTKESTITAVTGNPIIQKMTGTTFVSSETVGTPDTAGIPTSSEKTEEYTTGTTSAMPIMTKTTSSIFETSSMQMETMTPSSLDVPRTIAAVSETLPDGTSMVSGTMQVTFLGDTSSTQEFVGTQPTYLTTREVITKVREMQTNTEIPTTLVDLGITESMEIPETTSPTTLITPVTEPRFVSSGTSATSVFTASPQLTMSAIGIESTGEHKPDLYTISSEIPETYPESEVPTATDYVVSWLSTRGTLAQEQPDSEVPYTDIWNTQIDSDGQSSYTISSKFDSEAVQRPSTDDVDLDGVQVKCGIVSQFGKCQQEVYVAPEMEYEEEEEWGPDQVTDLPSHVDGIPTDLVISWLRSRNSNFKSRLCQLIGVCNPQT